MYRFKLVDRSLRAGLVDTPLRIWAHPHNRGRRVRRLARWLGWQAWQRTVRRPWIVVLHGDVRMVCHPHDLVAALVLYYGLYEPDDMGFLLAWLQKGDTFLDVGANVAPYSLLATSIDGVQAVAFEPADKVRERAALNSRLNRVDDRMRLVGAAVSDEDGRGQFTAGDSPTDRLVDAAAAGDVMTREVPTVRLDSFAAGEDLGRVALVKVDVEGHEIQVLQGGAEVLARHRPALVVEVNDPVEPLVAWIEASGYVPVRFDPATGGLTRRELPSAGEQGNVLLVPDLDAAVAHLADGARRHRP